MKSLAKISIISFIVAFCEITYAQKSDTEQILRHSVSVTSFDLRSKDLQGSIYVNDELQPAKLSSDEVIYSTRYDAYQDEMEVEKNGTMYYLPKTSNYTVTFIGTNKVYQVFSYEDKAAKNLGFFVVLYRGDKISLLNQEKIKYFEEVKPKTGYDKYQPPKLKRVKDKLYIGYENGTTTELPQKKKDILNLFSSKAKQVEGFAKKNKLNFKNEQDLIEVFKFYNSLN